MEMLTEQLDYYSKFGIPMDKMYKMYPQGQCESIDALYKLENDWRDIIDLKGKKEKNFIFIYLFILCIPFIRENFYRAKTKQKNVLHILNKNVNYLSNHLFSST